MACALLNRSSLFHVRIKSPHLILTSFSLTFHFSHVVLTSFSLNSHFSHLVLTEFSLVLLNSHFVLTFLLNSHFVLANLSPSSRISHFVLTNSQFSHRILTSFSLRFTILTEIQRPTPLLSQAPHMCIMWLVRRYHSPYTILVSRTRGDRFDQQRLASSRKSLACLTIVYNLNRAFSPVANRSSRPRRATHRFAKAHHRRRAFPMDHTRCERRSH
jgi:hypothetical protein